MTVLPALAKHISGGEIRYEYMGKNGNKGHYKITLILYRDINPQTINDPMDPSALIAIYNTGSNKFEDGGLVMLDIPSKIVELTNPDPCIKNPPKIKLEIGYYTVEVDLEFTQSGYTISYQRCCRVNDLFNINTSGDYGVTYTTTIPGSSLNINYPINSTPIFKGSDTTVICAKNYFKYDLSATDPDGDQLEYRFVEAFTGGAPEPPENRNPMALPPPYSTTPYSVGFSGESPLGRQCSLNPLTGVITGTAPDEGVYLIAVEVLEKRNGIIINKHRKDFHLKISNCTLAKAELNPSYISCDGLTFTFQNLAYSPYINTYSWDFDTTSKIKSSIPSPTYTYSTAGKYVVQLITTTDNCSDTAYATVKTFPGFNADFNFDQRCVGVAFPFTDKSQSKFGKIDKWYWDFGETSLATDISFLENPFHVFSKKGTYDVSLIVGNDIGCFDDTIVRITVEDKPYLSLRDTIMCTQDKTLKLNADGDPRYSWKWTGVNIVGSPTVQNPLVSPTVRTQYEVTLTQAPGCVSTASVFVDVRSFVSLHAGYDTTICLGDSILLSPISDGLSYAWSPASTVVNPTSKQTWARPTETTRYAVLAKIGKECQANDGFVVTTVPYPAANAGKDTLICFGKQMQLHASGGLQYLWYPYNTLDDKTVQDPTASPILTTDYVVGVYDSKGCPKPAYDTVRVRVIPPVKAFAGNDTSVVIGQPLQLNAQGGQLFQWTPPDFLSNDGISNPIARLNNDIKFTVKVSTPEGCFAYDEVNVKVYKTTPEIFVPTAFTPNGDGLNDNLVPIPVGIVSIEYFKVYNRYGELVFSTSSIGKGWDGVYKGREQGNESFVWQVLGKDYLGKPFYKKGQSTLIR